VTCTVDRGLSISEVATTVLVIVLDEDDNAPIAQINKLSLNGSELMEVSCVFLVDFLILWLGINRKTLCSVGKRGGGAMLKKLVITPFFLHSS